MIGEDLQVLSIPDLLNLEQQLDTGFSRVRSRKVSTVYEVYIDRMVVLRVLMANDDHYYVSKKRY